MNAQKTGLLIYEMRTRKGLTQKELAEKCNVTDKAVSKWECGKGCPDISLLEKLAEIFGTDVQVLLSGKQEQNESENGNMKKIKFYVCKKCGNIITASQEAAISCCGSKLYPLEPIKAEQNNMLQVEDIGGELFITSDHEMSKDKYISFVAYVNDTKVIICKQYPEWNVQINLPLYRSGKLVWYSTEYGLLYQDIRKHK